MYSEPDYYRRGSLQVATRRSGSCPRQDQKPLLLVVGSSDQVWREYMLRSWAEPCDLHLLSALPPTWEKPYIAAYDQVDTMDAAAMIEIARRSPEPFAGVITYWETRVEAVAEIARFLGVPSSPVAAIRACRDKYLGRTALKIAGVPQAESVVVSDLSEARTAAEQLGYPVVVKPRALGSSNGVRLVWNADELAAAYRYAKMARFNGVPIPDRPILIEEYLEGPEISVDSICLDGQVTPLVLAHKQLGFAPAFEEIGHIVQGDEPLLHDPSILDVLQSAHSALGLTEAMTHTELRRTETGPRVVEVNARTGGDMIPYIGRQATGIDLGRIAAELAIGIVPDLEPSEKRTAGVRFLYPERDLTVESITVHRDLLPHEVSTYTILAKPGQKLMLPPNDHVHGRYAAIFAEADSVEACTAALDQAAKAFEIH